MSDNYVWHGGERLATLLEDVPCEIVFDEYGIAGATLNYQCMWDHAPSLVSSMKYHPDFGWLKRKSGKISREEAMLAKVSITFEGIPEEEEEAEPTYSAQGSTSSEPIETHQRFGDFAGTPESPMNGAKFKQKGDDIGKFLGFFNGGEAEEGGSGAALIKPRRKGRAKAGRRKLFGDSGGGEESSNSKLGVKSFLDGGMTFSETKVRAKGSTSFKVDMKKLGKISEPPKVNDYVDVPEGRNWLLISCNVETVGDGSKSTRSWRLSGPKGWDKDIYT